MDARFFYGREHAPAPAHAVEDAFIHGAMWALANERNGHLLDEGKILLEARRRRLAETPNDNTSEEGS